MSQVMPVMQEQFVVEQSENYNMSISYLNQIYMQYQYMMNADFLMRGNYYEIESLGYGGLINMGINYYFG